MDGVKKKVVIVGAGPAGITAGYQLNKTGNFSITVVDRESLIGGLARTTDYNGYKFDIGPHHYITESPVIEVWWKNLMGDQFIELHRFTRIHYKRRYFNYPLEAMNVLKNLSLWECFHCVGSYLWYQLFPIKPRGGPGRSATERAG